MSSTIEKNVDEVTLVLTAIDKHGRLIRGLRQENFRVVVDDHPIEHFSYFQAETEAPLHIAVLIDVSGSLRSQLLLEARVVKSFFQRVLRAQDRTTILAFHQQVFPLNLEITHKRLARLNAYDFNGTAIYDALKYACAALDQPASILSRKIIVLLTDGQDNASSATLDDAINEVLRRGVSVYILETTLRVYGKPPYDLIPPNLKRLAAETGGQVWRATNVDVIDAFKKVEEAIRHQYVLAFKPAPESLDGRFHRLVVTSTKKNVRIRTRSGYFAGRSGGMP